MRRYALIAALLLGGCTTGQAPSPTKVTDTIKQVQAYTRTACSFVPTIATVAALFSASAGSAFSVASEICAAVTSAPLADGGTRRIVVRGIQVKGTYVR